MNDKERPEQFIMLMNYHYFPLPVAAGALTIFLGNIAAA